MTYRTGIYATLGLTLSSAALAAIVYTDAYSQAAQAEASGFHALTEQLASGEGDCTLAAYPEATVRQ